MTSIFRQSRDLPLAAAGRIRLRLLLQLARFAQLRGDWRSALRLWAKAADRAPESATGFLGYIGMLIHAGDFRGAADLANAFSNRSPKNENGQIALARIAEARGDRANAAGHWRTALALKPDNPRGLIKLGELLVAERQFEEAEACADRLISRYPANPHGSILRAQIAQQRDGFAAAATSWRIASQRFGKSADFLRAYGRALFEAEENERCLTIASQLRRIDPRESIQLRGLILARQNPYGDRTEFWKEACSALPNSADFTRKRLHAALWARRTDKSEAAFDRLIQQDRLNAGDAGFVIGLGNAYVENGDKAAARQAVRRFLKGLRGRADYRAAGLRLHRLILECFPQRVDAATAISRNSARFLRMVRGARLGAGAANALERIDSLEAALSGSAAICLFDTDIDPDTCRTFVRIVRDRLANATPFSLIRLGDGESNALRYESSFQERFEEDAAARERIWWDRTLDPDARTQLAARARDAIRDADALGIPTRSRLLRDVRLFSEQAFSATRSGRGLLAVMAAVEKAGSSGMSADRILASAHIHQDLDRWRLYGELFEGAGEIVTVSCHPALPDAMQKRFGVSVAKHVVTPPGDAMLEIQRRQLEDWETPPASLDASLEELGQWPQGRLVLVGAGYAGKVIVAEAKRRGGIALDLGSIFDRWIGVNTRSYRDIA